MSSFSKLILENMDGSNWKLVRPLIYKRNDGSSIIVAAGFETDFASIPRLFWRLLPPSGEYNCASVIHDWLYRTQKDSRVVADAIFLESMMVLGVSRWKRWTMYLGVRLFGWWAWRQNKKTLDAVRALAV